MIRENMAEIILNSEVVELKGDKILEKAVIKDRNTQLLRKLEIDKCILAVLSLIHI